MWVPVNSTGKVSDDCIRNLGFNPRLHKKLSSRTDTIGWNSLKKNICKDNEDKNIMKTKTTLK